MKKKLIEEKKLLIEEKPNINLRKFYYLQKNFINWRKFSFSSIN